MPLPEHRNSIIFVRAWGTNPSDFEVIKDFIYIYPHNDRHVLQGDLLSLPQTEKEWHHLKYVGKLQPAGQIQPNPCLVNKA